MSSKFIQNNGSRKRNTEQHGDVPAPKKTNTIILERYSSSASEINLEVESDGLHEPVAKPEKPSKPQKPSKPAKNPCAADLIFSTEEDFTEYKLDYTYSEVMIHAYKISKYCPEKIFNPAFPAMQVQTKNKFWTKTALPKLARRLHLDKNKISYLSYRLADMTEDHFEQLKPSLSRLGKFVNNANQGWDKIMSKYDKCPNAVMELLIDENVGTWKHLTKKLGSLKHEIGPILKAVGAWNNNYDENWHAKEIGGENAHLVERWIRKEKVLYNIKAACKRTKITNKLQFIKKSFQKAERKGELF